MKSIVGAILVLAGAVGIGAGQIASHGEASIAVGVGALALALLYFFMAWLEQGRIDRGGKSP